MPGTAGIVLLAQNRAQGTALYQAASAAISALEQCNIVNAA
jgi:hypothetical protein